MSLPRSVLPLAAALVLAALTAMPEPSVAQGRPDCTKVLRKMHRASSRGSSPDAQKIARALGVESAWVERCAEVYGRKVKTDDTKDRNAEGQFSERVEEQFLENLAREEKDTLGDTYFTVIDNDLQDRRKLKRVREADSINEWEPMETHEWGPNLGHQWRPYMHDDDLPPYAE